MLGETAFLIPMAEIKNRPQNFFLPSSNLVSFSYGAPLQILLASTSYSSRAYGDELHVGFDQLRTVKLTSHLTPARCASLFLPWGFPGTVTGHPQNHLAPTDTQPHMGFNVTGRALTNGGQKAMDKCSPSPLLGTVLMSTS